VKARNPICRSYRPGSEQHKECASLESRGFWSAPKREQNRSPMQVAGMIEHGVKEHL